MQLDFVKSMAVWVGGLGLLMGTAAPGAAASHTTARLLIPAAAVRPGETVRVGVQLTMDPGWHTYWENGGDSGAPTQIRWDLPPGFVAGAVEWPVPEKHTVAGLSTYILSGEAVLLVPLQVTAEARRGPAVLKANVSWLECSDLCLPGEADVTAVVEVGDTSRPAADLAWLEAAQRRLPRVEGAPSLAVSWEGEGAEKRSIIVEWEASGTAPAPDFFPLTAPGYEVGAATERLAAGAGRVRLRKDVQRRSGEWPAEVRGLLVEGRPGDSQAWAVTLRPVSPRESGTVPEDVRGPPGAESASVVWMLFLAFLGGVMLNCMPCVLPVIALKVLSFVSQSRESPRRVRWLGTLYGLGVLVSFVVLAVVAIVVQQAGGIASWGMVLQNQVVRVVLTVGVTLVALNLFGVFEVSMSARVMGAAGELTSREGAGGAFLNGVLATVLATPCTAPFLTVALAFAFTQPPGLVLVFFLATGLGLAAPFVALCWQPGWMKWLPRPGAWMERFKVAMGFPMLATAVWLYWVAAPRYGKGGVLWLGLFLVGVSAAAWTWGQFVQRGNRGRGVAAGVAMGLVALGYFYLLEGQLDWRRARPVSAAAAQGEPGGIDWQVWSPEAVVQARAQGRPVLVDFTADNCLNCQVNKATSLEIEATRSKVREVNAVALLGDFTDQDPRIAAELKRFQRAGVPLVIVYPKDPAAAPIVLPPILTPALVLEALERASRPPPGG